MVLAHAHWHDKHNTVFTGSIHLHIWQRDWPLFCHITEHVIQNDPVFLSLKDRKLFQRGVEFWETSQLKPFSPLPVNMLVLVVYPIQNSTFSRCFFTIKRHFNCSTVTVFSKFRANLWTDQNIRWKRSSSFKNWSSNGIHRIFQKSIGVTDVKQNSSHYGNWLCKVFDWFWHGIA